MIRVAALLASGCGLLCGGCGVVGAAVGATGQVAAATVTTAGKLTVATVKTTGKVATAAVTSSGDVTAGGLESAAKLSKTGMVVVVDGGSGAVAELPWRDGLRLAAAMESARVEDASRALAIYQGRHVTRLARLAGAPDFELRSGDVIEILR